MANAVAGVLVGLDLDRRPALIKRNDLLTDGLGLPLPAKAKYIVATLAVDKDGGAAVVYAATMWTGPALLLLDFDTSPLSVSLFPRIGARVRELTVQCKARGSVVFVPSKLLSHAQAVGLICEPVPAELDPAELLLSAGSHTLAGNVKICDPALEKAATAPFSGALDFRASENVGDPLRAAAVTAIALALDGGQR